MRTRRGVAEIMLIHYSQDFDEISYLRVWLTKYRRNRQPYASAASARAVGTSGSALGQPASPRRERRGTTLAGEWIPGGTIDRNSLLHMRLINRKDFCARLRCSSGMIFFVRIFTRTPRLKCRAFVAAKRGIIRIVQLNLDAPTSGLIHESR